MQGYQRTNSGKLRRYLLGTLFLIECQGNQFAWTVELPTGPRRGTSDTEQSAHDTMQELYERYAAQQWMKGALLAGEKIVCPLK